MKTEYFTDQNSIVREIWGKSDTILFIFAGASAEFALNKAVDWLYFTGKLPADPLGRLFSTVSYARLIVFAEKNAAFRAIDSMAAIHAKVENNRGASIPDWAYRDVLFMLIDYSIRSFEVLRRKLTEAEKTEVFEVFNRVGTRMGLKDLPQTFAAWKESRAGHLARDLRYSNYTDDLFAQYRKHLGAVRYALLTEVQILVTPEVIRDWLSLRGFSFLRPFVVPYRIAKSLRLDWLVKALLLPPRYKDQIKALDLAQP